VRCAQRVEPPPAAPQRAQRHEAREEEQPRPTEEKVRRAHDRVQPGGRIERGAARRRLHGPEPVRGAHQRGVVVPAPRRAAGAERVAERGEVGPVAGLVAEGDDEVGVRFA